MLSLGSAGRRTRVDISILKKEHEKMLMFMLILLAQFKARLSGQCVSICASKTVLKQKQSVGMKKW